MLTGVILAGGHNRRMGGQNKALLSFPNERLIERQIRIMRQNCDEIIVVSNEPRTLLPILKDTVRIITDYISGKGPLSGMHAAFSLSKNPYLWVVGCGMPYICPNAADLLWKHKKDLRCDAIIPFVGNQLHPLHGIYHKSCSSVISKLLELECDQYKVHELFNNIYYETLSESLFAAQNIDLKFLINIHSPEDYKQILRTSHTFI